MIFFKKFISVQNASGINVDTKFTGNFMINNKTIFDLIYPVGSIYISVSNTDPGNLFGKTWVAWSVGRVPVGVNTRKIFSLQIKSYITQ